MRVALIALHFAEYTARLALAIAALGHKVQLHLSAPNAILELEEPLLLALREAVDLRLHPHPARKFAPLHGARIAAQLRGFRPDVIHAQEAAPWTTAAAIALGPNVPLVLTVHDPLPHSGADLDVRRRSGIAGTRLRRAAAALIVHGRAAIGQMLTADPTAGPRTHAILHGTLGGSPPGNVTRDPHAFLFFGRIEAYKGLGTLLDAIALSGETLRVIIAGRGGDLDAYRERIAALPGVTLDDRFIPAGEVPGLFASVRAVVMPYLDATQSGVAALAFTAGTPVIASRVGALPDVVTDGENGLLIPPGDPGALAAAMARLHSDDALAQRLAAGAAETAATRLSWGTIAAETVAVYRTVTGCDK